MQTYAYQWADGTVSVCSVRNKEEAVELFHESAPVTRKLVIGLKESVLFAAKPDIDKGWVPDEKEPFSPELICEILERCYPNYEEQMYDPRNEAVLKGGPIPDVVRKKLETALKRDMDDAKNQIKRSPAPPDFVNLFPKGLPGQEN